VFVKKLILAIGALVVVVACSAGNGSIIPGAKPQSIRPMQSGGSGVGPYVRQSSSGAEALATSLPVAFPSAVPAGDVVVAFVADDNDAEMTSGGGWTVADAYANGNMTINVAWHVAQSGDTGKYTLTMPKSGLEASYALYDVENASTSNPVATALHAGVDAGGTTFATQTAAPTGYLSLPLVATANFGDHGATPAPWTNTSGWNQDQYQAQFEFQTLSTADTTTMSNSVSESSTSNFPSAYPGIAEIVLVNSQPEVLAEVGSTCQAFPQNDSVYNSRVDQLAADPMSTSLIQGYISNVGGSPPPLEASVGGWFINEAASPTYTMVDSADVQMKAVSDPVPFSASMNWEDKGISADHHIMILNTSCEMTEGYASTSASPGPFYVPSPNPNNWFVDNEDDADYASQWSLMQAYPTAQRTGGVNLSKAPQFAGIIRESDLTSGCVCHALNIDVINVGISNVFYLFPANTVSDQGASGGLPDGAHLRLKESVTATSICGAESSSTEPCWMVVTALHDYGAYVVDQDSTGDPEYLYVEDYLSGGSWTPAISPSNLGFVQQLTMSDFEVVAPPGCTGGISSCEKT
jgi:hypothetical protein